jgi:hypothetical protein
MMDKKQKRAGPTVEVRRRLSSKIHAYPSVRRF